MTTFAEFKQTVGEPRSVFTDNNTPANHFGVTATVLGRTSFYLFEGKKGSEKAIIKGRIELEKPYSYVGAVTYKGNGIKGGEFQGGLTSFEEAFLNMV